MNAFSKTLYGRRRLLVKNMHFKEHNEEEKKAPEVEAQRKRYKDTLKQSLKIIIDTETWHELAENRTAWRQAVK